MRVLVLSASIYGKKVSHMVKQEGVSADFIFYNESNLPTRTSSFTPRMTAKIPKMLGWLLHPGYDYYIWIDDRYSMSRPDAVAWFLENIQGHDALFFKHPERSSVLKEAEYMDYWSKHGREHYAVKIVGEPIVEQAKMYCSDHNFKDNLLIEAGVFCYSSEIVKNTEYNVMKEWFFEVCTKSIRDQLSLPYVLQKFRINYKLLTPNARSVIYLR
jgi:hypothetical protein